LRMARPALVAIRCRNPCRLARRRLFGWNGRFTHRLRYPHQLDRQSAALTRGPGTLRHGQSTSVGARSPPRQPAGPGPGSRAHPRPLAGDGAPSGGLQPSTCRPRPSCSLARFGPCARLESGCYGAEPHALQPTPTPCCVTSPGLRPPGELPGCEQKQFRWCAVPRDVHRCGCDCGSSNLPWREVTW